MRRWLAGCAAALATAGPAVAADGAQGRWLTASGNVEVEIAPCGPALCGAVARVLANHSMSSVGQTAKAPPPTLGLQILSDLRPDGPGRWKGHIYNRENGKTYDCLLTPQGGTMTVRAYVLLPAFGQTQVWRRTDG